MLPQEANHAATILLQMPYVENEKQFLVQVVQQAVLTHRSLAKAQQHGRDSVETTAPPVATKMTANECSTAETRRHGEHNQLD